MPAASFAELRRLDPAALSAYFIIALAHQVQILWATFNPSGEKYSRQALF